MKPAVALALALVVGAAAGAGAGYGVLTVLKPAEAEAADPEAAKPAPEVDPVLVILPEVSLSAPLVFPDGRLAGYARFTFQLEVAEADAPRITEEMPVLLNAINLRTFRTPMARDPDGQVPDLDAFRAVLTEAHEEAFGPGVVRRALITAALPDA